MVRAYLRDALLALTHTAQEVVLMVQLLSSLHGAVSYLLIAGAADHGGGHSEGGRRNNTK